MRNKIIEESRKYLGTIEGSTTHKKIVDTYNTLRPLPVGHKLTYNDNWCAGFVTVMAINTGCINIFPVECGCQRMIDKAKQMGIFVEDDNYRPATGDLIFYDWQDTGKGDCVGWSDHVGIVEKVFQNMIHVIEGNNNDGVRQRIIPVGAKYIRGFACPKYPEATTGKKTVEEVALEVIDGKWSNGVERRSLLVKAGYDYEEVQKTVNSILNGKESSIYYPKYKGTSGKIDEVLKSIGVPDCYIGRWKDRRPLAQKNGIANYTGTSSENIRLINLAKSGKLKK